jgi:hypothetical protein
LRQLADYGIIKKVFRAGNGCEADAGGITDFDNFFFGIIR